jgi:hypothetical protein
MVSVFEVKLEISNFEGLHFEGMGSFLLLSPLFICNGSSSLWYVLLSLLYSCSNVFKFTYVIAFLFGLKHFINASHETSTKQPPLGSLIVFVGA